MATQTEARISLRLPADLKADLEQVAGETRRSLNALIVVILERAIDLEPFVDDLNRRQGEPK